MKAKFKSGKLAAAILGLLLLVMASTGQAATTADIKNFSGHTVFRLVFHEVADPGDQQAAWDMNQAERDALIRATQYWAERLMPDGAPSETVVIYVTTNNEENAGAAPVVLTNGSGDYYIAATNYVLAHGGAVTDTDGLDHHAEVVIGRLPFTLNRNSQLGGSWNLESVMIHELGHALGISSLADDPSESSPFDDYLNRVGGQWVFQGPIASRVYGDGAPRDIPMDNASNQVKSHFGLVNGLMTHRQFRNYSGFMEAELAALNDIGYDIDLRDFFGRSIYTDGGVVTNTQGYFARDAGGGTYIDGRENLSSYGLGLHVFGSDNTVYQAADIMANGVGGGGIRSDGVRNNIIVNPGVTVQVNGLYGIGALFAYGNSSSLTNRGRIEALAYNGDAVRFDLGRNLLGDPEQSSYYEYAGADLELSYAATLLAGPLVKNFDLTGSLAAGRNAVYISPNAHVEQINVMRDAAITGDIISDYDDLGRGTDRATELTFGKLADADGRATNNLDDAFRITLNGSVLGYGARPAAAGYGDREEELNIGRGLINMTMAGGVTAFGSSAEVKVNRFAVEAGAGIVMVPVEGGNIAKLSANNFNLAAGSTVDFIVAEHDFIYGREYGTGETPVLELARFDPGGEFVNQSSVPAGGHDAAFSMGIYDYSGYRLTWDDSGQKLNLAGHNPWRNRERAGDYAVTAPGAMVVAAQGWDEVMRQSRRGLNQLAKLDNPYSAGDYPDSVGRLWGGPFYSLADQDGGDGRSGYDLKTPGVALGYDWNFDSSLLGLAMSAAWPKYDGGGVENSGSVLSAMLYGGLVLPYEIEAGALAGYDWNDYRQTRRVRDEIYETDYSGNTLRVGASAGRSFALGAGWDIRPGLSYEYFSLDVRSYQERFAAYSLGVDSDRQNIHRSKLGAELAWQEDRSGPRVAGAAGYSRIDGDRAGKADGVFMADNSGYGFLSTGDKLDRNNLDLGLSLNLPFESGWTVEANYNTAIGQTTTTHSGELKAMFLF
ncbi:MAG: autotransporter outer membrane beta-barrel domain-containing protein [Candidatus Adiutrix sp.]|jgi:hypothetical protein|nr:autotransporter outer membrane beta-barrel domain-containing protein [Candidatus Adiutrix sp.]